MDMQRTVRQSLAEHLISLAMERGEFDNLPGAGQPIPDLDQPYDEDWWLRKFLKREEVSLQKIRAECPK